MTWRGPWSNATAYAVNDAVSYSGSSYIAILANTGQEPDTSPLDWNVLASESAPMTAAGDMIYEQGGNNLALNAAILNFGTGTFAGAPANTVDGDAGTVWTPNSTPVWLAIDLQFARTINQAQIWIGDSRSGGYNIEYSPDGTTWTVAATVSSAIVAAATTWIISNFTAVSARYWRWNNTGSTGHSGLAEFQLFGPVVATKLPIGGLGQRLEVQSAGGVLLPRWAGSRQTRVHMASTTVNLASGAAVTVAFDTVDWDGMGAWDSVNHKIVALVAGYYQVNLRGKTNQTTGALKANLDTNIGGTATIFGSEAGPASANADGAHVLLSDVVKLGAGDSFLPQLLQDSGATVQLAGAGNPGQGCWMSVAYLGPLP